MFNDEERRLLLEVISNEQIQMIIKNPDKYESDKYKNLEKLKVKVKSISSIYEDDCK